MGDEKDEKSNKSMTKDGEGIIANKKNGNNIEILKLKTSKK